MFSGGSESGALGTNELRGTTKIMAEECHFKQRKYVSHDAFDFFFWDKFTQPFKNILYGFISFEYLVLSTEESMNPCSVHGTIKLHVVVGSSDGISYREMSYCCSNCSNMFGNFFSLSNYRVRTSSYRVCYCNIIFNSAQKEILSQLSTKLTIRLIWTCFFIVHILTCTNYKKSHFLL